MPRTKNTIDNRYESGRGTYDTSSGLSEAEQRNFNDIEANYDKTANPSAGNANIEKIRDREETPSGGWHVNADTFKDGRGFNKAPNKFDAKMMLKKATPLGSLGILGLIITAFVGSIGPASLLVNLKENFVENFDQQNITAEVRTRKLLVRRLTGDTTQFCVNKRTCSYVKPSKRFLDQLDKAGIKGYDKNGNIIETKRRLVGVRPDYYQLGDGTKVAAIDFKNTIEKDAKVRSAFRQAHNPRWANWVDKVSVSFMQKLGLSKAISPDLDKTEDPKKSQKAVDDAVKGDPADAGKMDNLVKDEAEKYAKQASKSVSKAKGDTFLMATMGVCAATKAPGVASNVIRAYRMRQLAKVAFIFLSAADAIKAGKATPNLVSNAGNLLTKTVNGRSAMDGAMMYGITGDVGAASSSKLTSKFIPGSGMGGFDKLNALSNSDAMTKFCSVASSQNTQIVMDAAKIAKASAGPAGWAVLLGDIAIGVIPESWIESAIGNIAELAVSAINELVDWDKVLAAVVGDATAGIEGEALGTATVIGGAVSMSMLANSGGNAPLSPSQYTKFVAEVENPVKLAWAKEDQLTHSPFDVSNPNTFLGSITTKLLPYYRNFSSVSGALQSISKVSFGSIAAITQPYAYAAVDYGALCQDDYAVMASGVAAGPVCDVKYAVPTDFIGNDPIDVVNQLSAAGQLDENGDVKSGSDLEDWIATCSNGSPSSLSDCTVDTQEKANYALFIVDSRAIDTMDNEPANPSSGATVSTAATSTGVSGSDQELAKMIVASKNIKVEPKYAYQVENYANGDTSCHINSNVLKLIATLGQTHSLVVSSINRQCTNTLTASGTRSLHYAGQGGSAVDFSMVDGGAATGGRAVDIKVYEEAMSILPDKKLELGQAACRPSGSVTIPPGNGSVEVADTCNHIHIGVYP